MLKFRDQTKDRISAELETGDAASDWCYALVRTEDPDFLPAIRQMLHRQDVPDSALGSAVRYLWNLNSPQAVDVLREVYDRKLLKSSEYSWMSLCEALAASGDGRGLPDAFAVLLDLEQPAEPPLDDQKRRNWESDRSSRKQRAETVFERRPRNCSCVFSKERRPSRRLPSVS